MRARCVRRKAREEWHSGEKMGGQATFIKLTHASGPLVATGVPVPASPGSPGTTCAADHDDDGTDIPGERRRVAAAWTGFARRMWALAGTIVGTSRGLVPSPSRKERSRWLPARRGGEPQ